MLRFVLKESVVLRFNLSKISNFPSLRNFHFTPALLKDKPYGDDSNGPRKSKFAKSDDAPTEKKVRSEGDAEKLNAARKEREQKKKETRLKQLEIQKKRDETKAKKAAPKAPK